jgi:hypothetical protein
VRLSVWLRASWKREAIDMASSGDAEACGAESEQLAYKLFKCVRREAGRA